MSIPITTYLHRKLTEVGTSGFEKLAGDTGVKVSFIRKFFYGGRQDPRVNTVQPLLDYFHEQDRKAAHCKKLAEQTPTQEVV